MGAILESSFCLFSFFGNDASANAHYIFLAALPFVGLAGLTYNRSRILSCANSCRPFLDPDANIQRNSGQQLSKEANEKKNKIP